MGFRTVAVELSYDHELSSGRTARWGWRCLAGKRRKHEQVWRNLLYCAPLWPNRADSSPRPFLSASCRCLPSAISAGGPQVDRLLLSASCRCPPSAISAGGPQVDWQLATFGGGYPLRQTTQGIGSSIYVTSFFQDGVQHHWCLKSLGMMDQLQLYHRLTHNSQRCVYTRTGIVVCRDYGGTTAVRIYRGWAQRTGLRGCAVYRDRAQRTRLRGCATFLSVCRVCILRAQVPVSAL